MAIVSCSSDLASFKYVPVRFRDMVESSYSARAMARKNCEWYVECTDFTMLHLYVCVVMWDLFFGCVRYLLVCCIYVFGFTFPVL